jgi:hypothetical protein
MFTSSIETLLWQRLTAVNMAVNMGEHDGFVGFMFTFQRETGSFGGFRKSSVNVFPVLL